MKNLKKNVLLAAVISASPVAAIAAEVSGNVSMTSDYRFRGISQTDTQPAIQGGFDVAYDNGVYIGMWGSNVEFSSVSMELDYYVGYSGSISEDISFDLGYIYYDYPGATAQDLGFGSIDYDYEEVYASISYKDFTLGAAYSDDYWLESGNFYYVYGDYSFALPHDVSLDLHYGYNDFENSSSDTGQDGGQAFLSGDEDSYSDYSITLTKAFAGVDVSLSWVDTDLSQSEVFGTNWADSTVVFAVSKSL